MNIKDIFRTSTGSLWAEFKEQANHPPAEDKYIGACYQALLILRSQKIDDFFAQILKKRKMTSKHLVNLFFRAIQHIELTEFKNSEYPNKFDDVDVWQSELNKIFISKRRVLRDILINKDTTTTKYQRYLGPKVIVSHLFGVNQIKLVDFGCGGNLGLPGYSTHEPFQFIVDRTQKKFVDEHAAQKINMDLGLCVDKLNPNDPDEKRWRFSCSFYPTELHQVGDLIKLEKRLEAAENISLVQHDIRHLPVGNGIHVVRPKYFNVVIISTLFYMLNKKSRGMIIEKAKEMLLPEGVIIVQDFTRKSKKDDSLLDFSGSWFKEDFSYRTFVIGNITEWKYFEIFRWKNGRCREVKSGEDLKKFIDKVSNKSKEYSEGYNYSSR